MRYIFFFLVFGICACGPTSQMSTNQRPHLNRTYPGKIDPSMPKGPGCYAKCLIPDQYNSVEESHFEYTGQNYDQEGIEKRRIVIQEATAKWVKKKADKNCHSKNPDDCLVWCLVESPEQFVDIYEVVDTNLIKEFKVSTFAIDKLDERGGFTEWKEVICDNQLTKKLKQDIQFSLVERGYIETVEENGEFTPVVKAALVKFQKDNALPIGQLDFESLTALGVGI